MGENRPGVEKARPPEPRRFGSITVVLVREEADLATWEDHRAMPVLARYPSAPFGEHLVRPFDVRGFLAHELGGSGGPEDEGTVEEAEEEGSRRLSPRVVAGHPRGSSPTEVRVACCDGLRDRVGRAAGRIGSGVHGLSRALLRTEPPRPEVLAHRARRCFGEPGRSPACDRLGAGLVCRACGCLAAAKVRVASEACPLGKWGAVRPVGAAGAGKPRVPAVVRPPDG